MFDIPKLHNSEQRRLIEGKIARNDVEQDEHMASQGKDPDKARMKRNSKRRARQRFIENRVNN